MKISITSCRPKNLLNRNFHSSAAGQLVGLLAILAVNQYKSCRREMIEARDVKDAPFRKNHSPKLRWVTIVEAAVLGQREQRTYTYTLPLKSGARCIRQCWGCPSSWLQAWSQKDSVPAAAFTVVRFSPMLRGCLLCPSKKMDMFGLTHVPDGLHHFSVCKAK